MKEQSLSPATRPPRIVLVDDEEILSWCIRIELMAQGYDVTSVGSQAEGREAIEAYHPDLVICDQGLPDGDGLSLMCEQPIADQHIPVIMITAFTPPPAQDLAAAGAQSCLRKPFDLEILSQEVRRLLKRPETAVPVL